MGTACRWRACCEARLGSVRAGASCGSKGATIQRPGWAGKDIGFQPFPTERVRLPRPAIHHANKPSPTAPARPPSMVPKIVTPPSCAMPRPPSKPLDVAGSQWVM